MVSSRRLGKQRLTKDFFARDALEVAEGLIGCVIESRRPEGLASVRIVETEAYRGHLDPGSHGYRGITPRTEVMFGPPGRLYVYFTYGMHWCANTVCGRDGECQGVLLRAGEPVAGVELMRERRGGLANDRLLASGPGRLAQALGISKEHNGTSVVRGGEVHIYRDALTEATRKLEVLQTKRIGLGVGKGEDLPWRWVVAGHPHASRKR